MPTLSEFFRLEFVHAHLRDKHSRTQAEYQTSVNHFVAICGNLDIAEVEPQRDHFVKTLEKQGKKQITVLKHLKQLNTIFCKFPVELRVQWKLLAVPDRSPKEIADSDFQALYRSFGNENGWPKYLASKNRPHFWRTVMEFAATTALRREAVLSLEWRNVNTKERFVTVEEWQDKKNRRRHKPLTDDLLRKMLELKGFGAVTGPKRHCLFPWVHGDKKWYECWNRARDAACVTIGLHDLKRFSGELALRAGASELELMQHMDHADIKTTLKHYTRPKTRRIIDKLQLPLPLEFEPPPPDDPVLLGNEERVNAAHQFLDEQRLVRLIAAGIDMQRLAAAIRGEYYEDDEKIVECGCTRWKTQGNTELRVFDPESEVRYA